MAQQHQFLLFNTTIDQIVAQLNGLIAQGYTIIHWQIVHKQHSVVCCIVIEVQ